MKWPSRARVASVEQPFPAPRSNTLPMSRETGRSVPTRRERACSAPLARQANALTTSSSA